MFLPALLLAATVWGAPNTWDWNPPPRQPPVERAAERAWGWQSPTAVRKEPNDYWWNYTWALNTRVGGVEVSDAFSKMVEDPYHYHQWPLSDAYLNMPRAWAISTGSPSVVVAVMDVDYDSRHPDLAGNVWTNWTEKRGAPGVDDDNNELIDDINGWDVFNWDGTTYLGDYDTEAQHGTNMGSILGAVTNNEPWTSDGAEPNDTDRKAGIAGIAWNCKVLPVSYVGYVGSSYQPSGVKDNYAIEYVVHQKQLGVPIRVISASTTGQTEYMAWLALQHDILFVVGAGNGNTDVYTNPAGQYPGILMVGAVNEAFQKSVASDGSDFGPTVDLVTFSGVQLSGYLDVNSFSGAGWDESLWKLRSATSSPDFWTLGMVYHPTEYSTLPGQLKYAGNHLMMQPNVRSYGTLAQPAYTSGATPQVAGVAALLFSYRPELTARQVKEMLLRGCVNVDPLNTTRCNGGPCEGKLGPGALNAYRAMSLWGAVGDTVLSGKVYISGDVWVKPGATVTCAPGTQIYVAPDDLYEGSVLSGSHASGVNCYPWLKIDKTGFDNEPAVANPPKVEIFVSGSFDYSNATIYGWTDQPQPDVWSGIYYQGTAAAAPTGVDPDRVRDSVDGVTEAP